MNNKKTGMEEIDEKALLDSIFAKKNPERRKIPESEEPEESENMKYRESVKEKSTVKKKRTDSEDYRSVFLKKKELKTRQCVYISLAVHEKIQKIVRLFANQEMTVGGYIDTVLWEHLEANKEEINELYRKFKEQDDKIL